MKPGLFIFPLLLPPWAAARAIYPNTIAIGVFAQPTIHKIARQMVRLVQMQRLGWLYYQVTYYRLLLKYGYRKHPMRLEVDSWATVHYVEATKIMEELHALAER